MDPGVIPSAYKIKDKVFEPDRVFSIKAAKYGASDASTSTTFPSSIESQAWFLSLVVFKAIEEAALLTCVNVYVAQW
jgi:hypothetical protein